MVKSLYVLKKKILSDPYNSIIFNLGRKNELYIVGGYIRDILMGQYSPDRDFIIQSNIHSLIQKIRKKIGGTIIEFKKNGTIRIALENRLTFDFTELKTAIIDDLSKRDFTINAMAWSPDKGFLDPFNGILDLQEKRIRSISKKNLMSDPLRLLRAYRFGAEIGGSIEETTRSSIKKLHNNINSVSSERITLEMFNLLNQKHSSKYLEESIDDRILNKILYIPCDILSSSVKAISNLERALNKEIPYNIKVKLNKIFSQNISYKGLLCLEIIFGSSCKNIITKNRLKMSNSITKRLQLYCIGMNLMKSEKGSTKNILFNTFYKSKEASIDILITLNKLNKLNEYKKYKKIWKKSFLNPEEIKSISGIHYGSKIGEMIKETKREQFLGKIRNRKEAKKFIINFT